MNITQQITTTQPTHGKMQTAVNSAALYLVIREYCNTPRAQFAAELRPYLPALRTGDDKVHHDSHFKMLLHEADGDPLMMSAKQAFFKRVFDATMDTQEVRWIAN